MSEVYRIEPRHTTKGGITKRSRHFGGGEPKNIFIALERRLIYYK
jgi:hypothetical protein